jgi:hypothetical protein
MSLAIEPSNIKKQYENITQEKEIFKMKKVIIVCMVFMMMVSMTVPVFATPGAFVSSPSKNPSPELIEANNASKNCTAEIIITAYGNRDQLSAELRQMLEEAYAAIVGTQDVSALNAQLKTLAGELGINTSDLAVSDLFDISATDCDGHSEHGHFDITLKADTLKNFVCLLHYTNGSWVIVDGAEVTNEGKYLEFTEDEFSPFAIVVSTADIVVPPEPNNTWLIILIVLLLLIILALIAWYLYNRSKKKEEI